MRNTVLWNPRVLYFIHKIPTLAPIPNQTNSTFDNAISLIPFCGILLYTVRVGPLRSLFPRSSPPNLCIHYYFYNYTKKFKIKKNIRRNLNKNTLKYSNKNHSFFVSPMHTTRPTHSVHFTWLWWLSTGEPVPKT